MKPSELYSAGQLTAAIAALTEEVKKAPTDGDRRSFLAELLCVAGELERADAQLDAIGRMSSTPSPGLPLLRQLVRAERARQEFHSQGRVPEMLVKPTPWMELALRASIAIREGKQTEASEMLARAEELRPKARGKLDGRAFEDLRDLDDLTAGVFEVLTSTGKYYWVPIESIASCEFEAPAHPIDLLWRPAGVQVRGGPEGRVFVAAIYASHGLPSDDLARLGRRTDWIGRDGEAVRGVGLRTLLADDEARTLLEIRTLEIQTPA